MKPPAWAGVTKGIDLEEPPICHYCVDDWETGSNLNSNGREMKAPKKFKNDRRQNEVARSSISDLTRQVRQTVTSIQGSNGNVAGDCDLVDEKTPTSKFQKHKTVQLGDSSSLVAIQYLSGKLSSQERALDTPRPTHVSIFDPLNMSKAFIPGKTRPLPKMDVSATLK